jgi:hypothetical protein
VHPLSENAPAPVMDTGHELLGATLHLMCDDLPSLMKTLPQQNLWADSGSGSRPNV